MRSMIFATTLAAIAFAAPTLAAPVMMSVDWAREACEAWNKDPVLTDKLVESGWVKNDKGRGFKVMQVYRSNCGDKPTAELRVSLKDGKAMCVYGGAPETAKLDSGADYRFADAALPLFEKDIKNLGERYSSSTKEGFQNFLVNAVLQFYFTGDPAKAQEYYKILCDRYPQVVKPYKSYDDFLEDQFRLYTSSMSYAVARDLDRSYITRAILAMAVNEDDDAGSFEKQAKELATRWVDLEKTNLRGMIRYDKIREEVIVDFLTGRLSLPPDVLDNLKRRIGDDTVNEVLRKVREGEISAPHKETIDPYYLKDNTISPIQNGHGQ
jgi:hypothetical protein